MRTTACDTCSAPLGTTERPSWLHVEEWVLLLPGDPNPEGAEDDLDFCDPGCLRGYQWELPRA